MEQQQASNKEKTKLSLISTVVMHVTAVLFWLFIITKLFIYDVDLFLIQRFFPNLQWMIHYKFFIIVGVLATLWILTKNKHIISWTLFVLFYPFILFFWTIPVLIFKSKNWTIALAFINTIISFFSSLKYNFIVFAISAIGFCLLFNFNNAAVIYPAGITLLIILIVIYVHRFTTIFTSSSMYKIYMKVVNYLIKDNDKIAKVDDEIKALSLSEMNETQLQKWSSGLQIIVIINRGCYFLSSKLKEYQKSNLNILFYLLNLIILLFITVFFMSGLNYGLFKINQAAFIVTHTPNFFSFIYYSFNTIFLGTIPEIIAANSEAHVLRMIEITFSFFLITIFTVLIFNIKSKKHINELEKISRELTVRADEIESRVQSEYKLTISQAIVELDRLKSGLIKFIYFLSNNINK
jgi:hypothetical protein